MNAARMVDNLADDVLTMCQRMPYPLRPSRYLARGRFLYAYAPKGERKCMLSRRAPWAPAGGIPLHSLADEGESSPQTGSPRGGNGSSSSYTGRNPEDNPRDRQRWRNSDLC